MLLLVTDAKYIEQYKIKVFFNNSVIKMIDLKKVLLEEKRNIFRSLLDLKNFKNFKISLNTIVWENKADFAPEFLLNL